MDFMQILLGIVALLVGGLFFERSRRKSAEGLLDNLKTKEEILEKDKQINENNALKTNEELKRNQLNQDIETEKNSKDNNEDLENFFNKRNSN